MDVGVMVDWVLVVLLLVGVVRWLWLPLTSRRILGNTGGGRIFLTLHGCSGMASAVGVFRNFQGVRVATASFFLRSVSAGPSLRRKGTVWLSGAFAVVITYTVVMRGRTRKTRKDVVRSWDRTLRGPAFTAFLVAFCRMGGVRGSPCRLTQVSVRCHPATFYPRPPQLLDLVFLLRVWWAQRAARERF